ncbi:MAG: O-antigen ligase family protein, partial [Patescibacteria group bacterium]
MIMRGKAQMIGLMLFALVVTSIIALFFWLQSPGGGALAGKYLDEGTRRIVYELFQDPARVELSQIAWQVLLARPFFGGGPNNYSYVFSTFVKPEDYGVLFSSTWYDQAHNQVMNVLATMGIVGLLSYLALFVTVWWVLWSLGSRLRGNNKVITILLGLFFFAYFLQTLTAFDTIGPMIMLYLGLGLVYFLSKNSRYLIGKGIDEDGDEIPPHGDGHVTSTRMTSGGAGMIARVVGVVVAVVLAMIFINIVPYAKAKTGKRAIDVTLHDFDRGLKLYQRSLSGASFTHEDVRLQLAGHALMYQERMKTPSENKKQFLWIALTESEKSVEAHPWSLEYALPLLQLYRTYAEEYSDAVLVRADTLADRLAERYPQRRDVLYEQVLVAQMRSNYDKAETVAQKLIDLDPLRGESYWWAARIAIHGQNISYALDMVASAADHGYPIFKDGGLYLTLATNITEQKDVERALGMVEGGITNQPNTLDFRAARALLLLKSGKTREAQNDLDWLRERNEKFAKKIEELSGE